MRALDHREQRLIWAMGARGGQPFVLVDAALGPFVRALQRLLLVGTGIQQGGELVEGEHDVRAEPMLDTHRNLGCEPMFRAVEMRAEGDAVIVDSGQALFARGDHVIASDVDRLHGQHLLEADTQRHHLKAAAIGEGRAGPVHEFAQPTRLVHDVRSGL